MKQYYAIGEEVNPILCKDDEKARSKMYWCAIAGAVAGSILAYPKKKDGAMTINVFETYGAVSLGMALGYILGNAAFYPDDSRRMRKALTPSIAERTKDLLKEMEPFKTQVMIKPMFDNLNEALSKAGY